MVTKRRAYGEGSIYQRCDAATCPPLVDGPPHPKTGKPTKIRPEHKCEGLWVATIEAGWTTRGTRRRITVSGKTRAEAARKLRHKKRAIDTSGIPTASAKTTVKVYAERWLHRKADRLRPKAFAAIQTNVRRWIIPTIGHRRLDALTPADIRAIEATIRDAGRAAGTAAGVFRTVQNMLGDAVEDGHQVARAIEKMKGPEVPESDRTDLSLPETFACLAVASELPHGLRWLLALLYGPRQAEMLGLVENDPLTGEPCVDFDRREIHLAWQLQALRYQNRKNQALGFKVPRDYEVVRLVNSWHLVRPKSKRGHRVLPMIEPVERAMHDWLMVRPANPWGLVFPTAKGRPCNDKIDREEWWAIQGAASVIADPDDERRVELGPVPVGHPLGRYYHVNECRNVAATQLDQSGATDNVVTSVLGHSSILTSRGYMTAHMDAKRSALERVAERFGLLGGN